MNNMKLIRSAIEKAWPKLPDQFRAWQLWGQVNRQLPEMDTYNDTIMRVLRQMNEDSGYKMYRCVNRQESLYKKII